MALFSVLVTRIDLLHCAGERVSICLVLHCILFSNRSAKLPSEFLAHLSAPLVLLFRQRHFVLRHLAGCEALLWR